MRDLNFYAEECIEAQGGLNMDAMNIILDLHKDLGKLEILHRKAVLEVTPPSMRFKITRELRAMYKKNRVEGYKTYYVFFENGTPMGTFNITDDASDEDLLEKFYDHASDNGIEVYNLEWDDKCIIIHQKKKRNKNETPWDDEDKF